MTVHLTGSTWTFWQIALTVWLVGWAIEQGLKARKAYWQKQLSKTIAQKATAGEPVKVFVEASEVDREVIRQASHASRTKSSYNSSTRETA